MGWLGIMPITIKSLFTSEKHEATKTNSLLTLHVRFLGEKLKPWPNASG